MQIYLGICLVAFAIVLASAVIAVLLAAYVERPKKLIDSVLHLDKSRVYFMFGITIPFFNVVFIWCLIGGWVYRKWFLKPLSSPNPKH